MVAMKQRVTHRLNEIKKCEIPKHIICVDTETKAGKENSAGDVRLTLKLGWAVHLRTRTEGSGQWCEFTTVKGFWDWLEHETREKNSHYYVFAHNWHFDFNILDGFRELVKRRWKITRFVIESHPFIVDAEDEENRRHLTFIDTTNYVLKPLKSIGEDLGLPKLSIDFDKTDDTSLSAYCRRDVEILVLFIQRLIDFILENDLGNFQPTIAGLAFASFRHRFMAHDIIIHDSAPALQLESDSYRGGRNECLFIGKLKGKVYQLDINSQYPHQMLSQLYPVKLLRYISRDLSKHQLATLLKSYDVIARVIVELDKPAIAIKQDKLVFPVGRFEAVLTSPELEYVLAHGRVLRVKEACFYLRAKIFEDYVKFFYRKRQEYKQAKNDTYQLMAKIYLNSLYGKFGQRHSTYFPVEHVSQYYPSIEDVYESGARKWTHYLTIGGTKWEQSQEKYYSFDSFPAIASFVTAYARMYLWKLIETAGAENCYYMDTDSLFCNEVGYSRLLTAGLIDPKELGKLKLERTIASLDIKGCKDYTRDGLDVRKGIKKDAIPTADGGFSQPQFMKTKSMLAKGLSGTVVVRQVIKHRRTSYDKGVVQADGTVAPIRLDIPPSEQQGLNT